MGFPEKSNSSIEKGNSEALLSSEAPPPPPPPPVAKSSANDRNESVTGNKVVSLSIKKSKASTEKPSQSKCPVNVILEDVTLDLEQKSKIALVGKNGSGKSTLMKMVAGYGEEGKLDEIVPILEAGEIYKHHSVRIMYYQQHQQDSLPYDKSPLEYFLEIAPPGHNEQTLRAHLGSFGMCGDLALEKIGLLSGGQKARVVLSELTLFKPHMLLLDEPTNNLDLEGIKAMKEALSKYEGACIIASHDMSFLDQTVDTVYHVSKKKVTRLENGVEEYKQIVRDNVLKQKKLP